MMTASMMRTVVGALAVSLLIACAGANPEIVEETVDLLDDNVNLCKDVHWKAAVDGSDFEFLPGQLPETDVLEIVPKRCAEGEEVHITYDSKPVDGPILLACQADKSCVFVGRGEKGPVESTSAFKCECVKPAPEAGDLLNGEGPEPFMHPYGGYQYPERRYFGGDGYPSYEYQDPYYAERPAYGCKLDSHCEDFQHCKKPDVSTYPYQYKAEIGECVGNDCEIKPGACFPDGECVNNICEALDCATDGDCGPMSFCVKNKCSRFKNPYVPNYPYEHEPYMNGPYEPYMNGPYAPSNEYGMYGGPYGSYDNGMYGGPYGSYDHGGAPYGGDDNGMYGQHHYGDPYGGDYNGMYDQHPYGRGPYGGDYNDMDGYYPNQQYNPNPYAMPYTMPDWYKREYDRAHYDYLYPEYVDNRGYGGFGYYGYAPDTKCYDHKNNYYGMCGAGKYCGMNEKCILPVDQKSDYDYTSKPSGVCMQDCNAYENFACTADYSPLCGTDGKTYSNICEFRRAYCGVNQYQQQQYPPYQEYNGGYQQYEPYQQYNGGYQPYEPYQQYHPSSQYPEYQPFQQYKPYGPYGHGSYYNTLQLAHVGACDGYVSDSSDYYGDYNSTYDVPCPIKENLNHLNLSKSLKVLMDDYDYDYGYGDGCPTSITMKCHQSCKTQLVLYKKDDDGVYKFNTAMVTVDFLHGQSSGPCPNQDKYYFLISDLWSERCISAGDFKDNYSLGCPKKVKHKSK